MEVFLDCIVSILFLNNAIELSINKLTIIRVELNSKFQKEKKKLHVAVFFFFLFFFIPHLPTLVLNSSCYAMSTLMWVV